MKLYTKHSKIFERSYEFCQTTGKLHQEMSNLFKRHDLFMDPKNETVRRHSYLDLELVGSNYINMPFVLRDKE